MTERLDIHNSDVPLVCRSCEARHGGICGALTPEQLSGLSKHTVKRHLDAGTTLLSDAVEPTSYANVLTGVVKLTKMLPDGRQQILGLQFAPDFIGRPFKAESALTAEAATDVKLCSFPTSAFERIIAESPKMEHRLLQQTFRELDEARAWMVTLGRKTASEKVASFVWLIATHIDPEGSKTGHAQSFDLPLSRADIADFLGLTIETVSRQMTKLRKDGIIEIENNRHVTVHDLHGLEHRACL